MSECKSKTQSVYWRILQDIGELPPQWATTNIIDSTYIKGRIGWQGLKASEFTAVGPHLVTGTDFENGKVNWDTCYHITMSRFQEAPTIQLSNGDLLITKDGTIGKVAFVKNCPDKAILNSGIFVLRCSDDSYINIFLYYILTSLYFDKFISAALGGSTINHLYQREFEQFRFPIPSLPEQRKIARILSTVDEVIERTEAAIAKYQAIKQGMMHDLFTRGLDQHGKLRPRHEEAPELYHHTSLGWLPKEWEVFTLHQVAQVRTGIALNSKRKFNDPVTAHYLRVANVQDGYLDLTEMKTIQLERADLERYRVYPNDVLMNEGGDLDKLGRGTLWQGQFNPCVHQNHVFVVRCNSAMLPEFLNKWTETPPAKKYFMVAGKQTTNLASINKTQLGGLLIATPLLSEQALIIRVMCALEKREKAEARQLHKLKLMKQALMQALLTGRKPVIVHEKEQDN